MNTILDPQDSVSARKALSISQAAVARDTGISRVYVSQFETGRRILEDPDLEKLNDYYRKLGWSREEQNSPEKTKDDGETLRVRDGLIIANDISNEEAEDLLSELYDTKATAESLENEDIPRGFFNGVDQEAAFRKSIPVMLCHLKVRRIQDRLQGRIDDNANTETIDDASTVLDYINLLARKHNLHLPVEDTCS